MPPQHGHLSLKPVEGMMAFLPVVLVSRQNSRWNRRLGRLLGVTWDQGDSKGGHGHFAREGRLGPGRRCWASGGPSSPQSCDFT